MTNGTAGAFCICHIGGSRSTRSGLADINVLARGASNAKWHSGCLAPDRCVESICDWLIRGPLFLRGRRIVGQTFLSVTRIHGKPRRWQTGMSAPRAWSDQVSAHCPDGGLRTIGDSDFAQDVLHVLFDRLIADAERLGDFFVREAKSQLFKHFAFALG